MTEDGGTFDHIVIGAGSSGAVAAARLSEDAGRSVLLLEAGGMDRHPGFRLPLLMGAFIKSGIYNWGYQTEPEPEMNGRTIPWPRGRVIGGTSTLNGMVYIRGVPGDYDGWAQAGNPGWSWAEVLPYFLRAEGHEERRGPLHSATGPLTVTRAKGHNPLVAAFIEAGREAGYPVNDDFNGPSQEGFGRYDFTIRKGKRCGTARAYLRPALARAYLTLCTHAQVARIIVESGRAVAVDYRRGGKNYRAKARHEILLSGGAINSPHLLMLSGIGPAEALQAQGIPVLADLPGVGQNLMDHFDCSIAHASPRPISLYRDLRADRVAWALAQGVLFGKGAATVFPYEGGAFLKTQPGAADPDVQIHFMHGREDSARVHLFEGGRPEENHGFTLRVSPTRPESRGWVRLASADPFAPPRMAANYLSTDYDRRVTLAGLRAMREVVRQPVLAAYAGAELSPGPRVTSDADLLAWLRTIGGTTFHPSGTCAMGRGPGAVVDHELRVHGVAGLRVADASVMPSIVSGNTNAACIMIGEKVAEMIKAARR